MWLTNRYFLWVYFKPENIFNEILVRFEDNYEIIYDARNVLTLLDIKFDIF